MPGCTISPRRLLIIVSSILTLTGLHAEVRHVSMEGNDQGRGSEKAPWRTIQAGLDRLHPGDTLVVHPGKYPGPLQLHGSGSAKDRIVIRGMKEAVIEAVPGSPTILIAGASWITWEGFSIGGELVVSGNPSGLVVRFNTFHGEGKGTGIRLANARGAVLERNLVSGYEQGIVVAGFGNRVIDNIVRNNTRSGIVLGNIHSAQDTLVRNNTLSGNGGSPHSAGGLWIRYATNSIIENNILVSSPGRRLFSIEDRISGDQFRNNLYFSPSGEEGAMFCQAGKQVTGFVYVRLATRDSGAVFADPQFADATASLSRLSPAIDLSASQPFPGEQDFSGTPRRMGLGMDVGAQEFAHATGLHREGNQLIHQNRLIRLRGVGLGDPVLDRRDQPISQYETIREKWNANVVRISIHPYVWRNAHLFGGQSGVLELIRREIDAATGAGLFVILDWHITGWPDGFAKPSEPGEFPGLHDSSFDLASSFWEQASQAFGDNGAVAFELWNEPVKGPTNWQPDAAEWKQLTPYWERLTAIIRQHSNNLIILAGGSWAYSLKGIRELPPTDANVAFSWHVYASKENNDEARWATAFDNLSQDFPVVVSEWGFDEMGAPYFRGGVSDFGAKFATNWLEGRELHWVAWCWHSAIGPAMLRPDWTTPTPFGAFVKGLLRLNPKPEPPQPRFLYVPETLDPTLRPDFLK